MNERFRMMAKNVVFLSMTVLLLVACGPGGTSALPEPTATAVAKKTPKPTFTPVSQAAAPTLAPTMTPRPVEQPTSTTQAQPAQPTKATEKPSAVPTEAPMARPVKSLRMKSPEYGMQAFLWWRPEVASRDLQLIRDAGFTWCKVNFGWREIEGAGEGVFDWSHTDQIMEMATEVGLDLVVRIDHQPSWAGGGFPGNGPPDNPQDLADFFTALATRYKGRIRAYEVWNEPNLAREWGGKAPDPGAYIKLLRIAYAAIKAADPDAMVISAGLSPTATWSDAARPDDWYLKSMYIAMGGNSDGYFDVLGAHGPGYKSPPEMNPSEVASRQDLGGNRFACFRHVEDLRAIMVENGDDAKQVALLEFGWTSDSRPDSPYYWHTVSEETKADYIVRAYRYAKEHWSPWIGLMSLIYISDHEWTPDDEQYWWAITYPGWPEFKPRPAYESVKAMPK
jgi:hypothetical protein